jgi:cob(I)alamin adenosyltransferase
VKIYTKTGDGGETSLLGGARVPKDHHRVAAYGDVDETNAAIGAVRALAEPPLEPLLFGIQKDLFAVGARLADPTDRVAAKRAKAAVTASHVRRLEKAIDAREEKLPPLRSFVLPGGTPAAALLHQARTVCRRAERAVVTLAREGPVDPTIVVYLNRLSDLLFVLARFENHRAGLDEPKW